MQIHWAHTQEIEPGQREKVETRLRQLAEGHSDLIDVRITGRTTGHHRHGDQEVRIVCQARGREIVASRARPDLGLALEEAMQAFEREVHRLRDRRSEKRPDWRGSQPPVLGIVDRVDRDGGFGFILTDAGEQVYFHQNAVQSGLDFDALSEGDRVALDIEAGDEGPQATVVSAPLPGTPSP
jgi:cold shock CspA family protein/ribosome-associated translation inhibitor RaiA